jgi:hypothetical protein
MKRSVRCCRSVAVVQHGVRCSGFLIVCNQYRRAAGTSVQSFGLAGLTGGFTRTDPRPKRSTGRSSSRLKPSLRNVSAPPLLRGDPWDGSGLAVFVYPQSMAARPSKAGGLRIKAPVATGGSAFEHRRAG